MNEAMITGERGETETEIIGELEGLKQRQILEIDKLIESIRSKREGQKPVLATPQNPESPIASDNTTISPEATDAQAPSRPDPANEPVTLPDIRTSVEQTVDFEQAKTESQVTEQPVFSQAPPAVDTQAQIEDIKRQISEM